MIRLGRDLRKRIKERLGERIGFDAIMSAPHHRCIVAYFRDVHTRKGVHRKDESMEPASNCGSTAGPYREIYPGSDNLYGAKETRARAHEEPWKNANCDNSDVRVGRLAARGKRWKKEQKQRAGVGGGGKEAIRSRHFAH